MQPRRAAVGFIFVTLFLDILGIGLIVPILPHLVENMEGGDTAQAAAMVGWLGSLYALMQFVFSPVLGSLSDRFGRRPVILLSLLGAAADYLLLAWAPTLAWLFVARIISGITSANISAASAYIADVTPPEKRAAGFGMIGAAFGLGFIAGPAIGGWLGEFGLRVMGDEGIRLPFYAAAAVTFANALYGAFVLPESLAPENRRDFSWRRANPFAALKALARWPVVAGMAATHFFINLAHNIYPALWVLYTGYRFGWGPKEVGTSLAAVGIMAALVQGGLAGRIVGAIGERRGLVLGLLATALALAGYGLAPAGWMIYAIIVAGSLGGIANPSAQTIITKAVDADQQGAVQGALGSIASIASIAAPLLWTNLFRFGISEGGSASLAPFHFPGIAFLAAAATTLGAIFLAKRAFAQVDRSAAAEAET